MSSVTTMPQNVPIRLNVGGTVFHTSRLLHTLMEGAHIFSKKIESFFLRFDMMMII